MKAVYVDTSALLPLLDRDDQDHGAVVAALETLARTGTTLFTSSYTLVETGALVRSRLGMKAFQALGETVDQSLEVVWVDEELHRRAWSHAAAEPRRGASLVDWVGFLLMKDFAITAALAVDEDFARHGFATLPTPDREQSTADG